MANTFKILLVDDEEAQRETLGGYLSKKGYYVKKSPNAEEAFDEFTKNSFDLIISDFKMPGKNGEELIMDIRNINPEIPAILITAFGEIQDAVRIMKFGAIDYIQKPIDLIHLINIINKYEEQSIIFDENKSINEVINNNQNIESISNIIYGSDEMKNVLNIASRVALSKASVLIRGESGTGKELIAKAIHSSSKRNTKPFIVVNCAALPETLFESELFGHEKGAFTGAVKERIGKFERADKGTLFIDEVGDIPLTIQVKLLRALQFGEIERLGSEKTMRLDVRVISATNRNLEDMIANGEFREDLFFRLNVVTINLPPLRQRKKDIKPLVHYYIDKYSKLYEKNIDGIDNQSLDKMIKYNYPGNIRELENIVQRAVVLTRDRHISIKDLPIEMIESSKKQSIMNEDCFEIGDLNSKVEHLESVLIKKALLLTEGNQTKAAELLNISERTLRYKINKYELK